MFQSVQYGNLYGSELDPFYVKKEERGKNCICVMALGRNELKDSNPIGAKVAQVMIENYLRRPSLKDEAISHLMEFGNNAVMVAQSPTSRVECHTGILLIHGDGYRWSVSGNLCFRHYVDGQEIRSSGRSGSAPLGEAAGPEPESTGENRFEKGENSFLICSENVCRVLSGDEIEDALSQSESAQEWLQSLRMMFEDRCDEPYAIQCVFAPDRKKRALGKPAVIAIILVLVAAIAFAALGAMRRRSEGPEGPGQPGFTGQEPTRPPQPEGMDGMDPMGTHPPKPTRPPKPDGQIGTEEWTEPPMPTEPGPSPEDEIPDGSEAGSAG